MTQPPLPPLPPAPFTGLDDLGDDDLAGLAGSQSDSPFENPDFVVGGVDLNALEQASPNTDLNEIEPGVPAQAEEPKKKRKQVQSGPPKAIDWSKATPRKEDDFAQTPGGEKGSPVSDQVRNFLNNARQNEWYGLFYPILEFGNRNTAQSWVTKVNQWRKGKTNTFGVRDGENISAKCETQEKGKYVLWVGLLQDPGAKGEVDPAPEGPSATPAAE